MNVFKRIMPLVLNLSTTRSEVGYASSWAWLHYMYMGSTYFTEILGFIVNMYA